MSNFPPERIEDALKFCCCSFYRDRQICIYAGGGSASQHDMYWAYAIYDANGDRLAYENLQNCLDVDDGLRFCENLIDQWDAPITYEDVRLWRDICEYLSQRKSPTSSYYITLRVPGCDYLVGYDRTHRQKLWDKFKIQLIVYEKFSKKYEGWRLKGNWEDKIDFLEQVYILGRDPESLPRPWLDKWERKQQAKKYQELVSVLRSIEQRLDNIHSCDEWTRSGVMDYLSAHSYILKGQLENLSYRCKEAKGLLSKLLRNEPD
ncbi:MAG: hypothetical protein V7K67_27665 [Nostoc sp.]|uniref:hypothetical protein n=1 Tax=Nostoc sp. TaxID=1180 RepID=UPI002FF690A5